LSIVVVPASTAATPPGTATTPAPMDKARFRKLLDYRRSLYVPPPERSLSDFVDERVNALMTQETVTPQANAELAKAIAAEEQRRKDEEAARQTLIASIDKVLSKFTREHPEEARSVYEAYLPEVEQQARQAVFFQAEFEMVKEILDRLSKSKK
jgi:hypothetical protein